MHALYPSLSALRRHAVIAAAAIMALAGPAPAETYKFVDDNGVTVYSQTPPPGAGAESVHIAPGPGGGETEAARERLGRQIEADFDQRTDDAKAAEEQARSAHTAADRADACAAARQNLQTLENLGARMLRMPDGKVRRPGEQERLNMMEETRGQIADLCD